MPDPLLTPQTIIAYSAMAIVAATVAETLILGDVATRNLVVGGVMSIGSAIMGYYFGSSKGSAAKDAIIASLPPVQ